MKYEAERIAEKKVWLARVVVPQIPYHISHCENRRGRVASIFCKLVIEMLRLTAGVMVIFLGLCCSLPCMADTEASAARLHNVEVKSTQTDLLVSRDDSRTSTVAEDLVTSALAAARAESKNVFLLSGFPECSWCKLFDRYHAMPEVEGIAKKYYVIEKLDTENMPDGRAVFEKYAEPGAPAWVIMDPSGKVLFTSYDGQNGNVGFPYAPEETAHYVKALKATSPVSEGEIKVLTEGLQKAAARK